MGADDIPSATVHELRSVDGALIELITELRQIHAALTLLSEVSTVAFQLFIPQISFW